MYVTYVVPLKKSTSFIQTILFCSDIRGVAIAGVEGEPVNITEPVTEAIAAAFAAWLLNKKKSDGLRRLRISVGHDSRISAHKLQVTPDFCSV
jgi:phosphomannomutase